jgi:predicted small lipoprotein YifL
MKSPHFLLAGLLPLALSGCMSFIPAGPLDLPPQERAATRSETLMVNDVSITDSDITPQQNRLLIPQLTSQLAAELENKGYFEKTITFPATAAEQDVQLQLTLSSLKARRTAHPAYFPGAILTATIWIWANGPIYIDKYDLAGTLSITDAQGKSLASSQSRLKSNQSVGFWSQDYLNSALGAKQLNQLIGDLLTDSLKQLH